MAKHRITLGRRGIAALAAAGALVIGGATATMMGTGNADVIDALTAGTTTTTVLPDLEPFKKDDVRGDGKAEVSDEYGAPTGGGKAALRLSTPTGADKVSYYSTEDAGTPLADWIPTAAYSAYQGEADQAQQFPSLQLIVDYNGAAAGGYSALTYEPVYNPGDSTTQGAWHRYQAGAGLWCSTQVIPGVVDADHTKCSNGGTLPLSAFTASEGIVVNAVEINQGSGNPGLESAVDLISTPSTTYDFELTKPVIVPPVTDPTSTTTTEPSTPTSEPGEHGGGWGGDGQSGHGDDNGGGWGNTHDNGNGNGQDDGHCGCRK